jgi:Winged helix DNA-binding domain
LRDHGDVTEKPVRVLTQLELNRTLLERQLLLERAETSIEAVVEQVGGLQTQYAPSGYVGLWTRLAGFQRDDLTRALEDRSAIQATLMRTTIHLVSRREYWRYAMGVREARREWAERTNQIPPERKLNSTADELRAALADGPRTVKELGDIAKGFIGTLGYWVDLVRVPPSGTWERRRADRLALAETWVGPNDATEEEGLEHLVRAYLRAFGPAPWKDIAQWAGISVVDAKRGAANLALVPYRFELGGTLHDLEDAAIADPGAKTSVRFLPHWDANLLVHARRTRLLPEAHRSRVFSIKNPFSVGTYLVDGRVVGGWSLVDKRIVLDPYEPLGAADSGAVEREREALEAFHA